MPATLTRWFLLFVILATTADSSAVRADESYSWNFLTEHFDNVSLVPHGKAAIKLLRPRKDGLHIVIPADEDIGFSGFAPRFQISGDFEMILGWMIKTWKKPESGYGTGPSLYLTTEGEFQPAASLGRVLRANGRSVYSLFLARGVDGERRTSVRMFDSEAEGGRLRIKRTGKMLEFAVSDVYSTGFKVLDEQEFTAGDVNLLRAGLQQSDSSAHTEVILTWFSVHATDLPHLPSEQERTEPLYAPRYNPPPATVSYAWLWQSIGAASLAGATIIWFVRRRR